MPSRIFSRSPLAVAALRRSCARIARLDPAQPLGVAAFGTAAEEEQLARFAAAANAAQAAGLGVNAGHDLNRDNLTAFLRTVPGVSEVSIGHALMADALEMGYTATISEYNRCIAEAR